MWVPGPLARGRRRGEGVHKGGLLEQGQPIYYTGSHDGTEGSFEQGVKDAQTWADYISYDMEHAPFDVKGLADYMKGLAKGGPTKSGHKTPAVIVNVPVNGTDAATVRANAWMFQQVLATGVHGIMLCHADDPGAVRAFIEAVRFPNHMQGVGKSLSEGRRGAHGTPNASQIWGITERLPRESRRLAAQSERRAAARPQARRQIRARECRRQPEGARRRVCRVGPGRHGALARRPQHRARARCRTR